MSVKMRTEDLNACTQACAHEWNSRTAKCEGEGTQWEGLLECEERKAKRKTEGGKAEGGEIAGRVGWRGVWRGSNYEDLARPGPAGRITLRPLAATYLLRRHE